jgi:dipeptidyl aminopeptidase/acylaminoacyl peptidase
MSPSIGCHAEEVNCTMNSNRLARKIAWVVIGVALVAVVAYFAAGYLVYNQLANVDRSCDVHLANQPDHFTNLRDWPEMDYSPFYMPAYEEVRFPSRDPRLTLAGWYVPAGPDAPAVIVVDGIGGCKHAQAALLPAGMLWRHGYNVLLMDLRDTGGSDREDGFSAVGTKEYQDVLGAWDWLVREQGIPPEHIGILGNSLGAATVLNAFGLEPRVAAIALNSPFSNLPQIMREELQRSGFPTWLTPAAVLIARLVRGDNLVKYDPVELLLRAGDRPVFVLHSRADPRIRVHHSQRLEAAAQAAGPNAAFWYVDDADHVQTPGLYPAEFQQRLFAFFDSVVGL